MAMLPHPNKHNKESLLLLLKNSGAFATARAYRARAIRILCYHGAWLGGGEFGGDSMFIAPATFQRRLALIRELGYRVISLDHAAAALRGHVPAPQNAVVITIDDGWYSAFAVLLPALRQQGMEATIYCDTRHLVAGLPIPHVMARYLRKIACADAALPARARSHFHTATDLSAGDAERYAAMLQFAASLGIDVSAYLERRAFGYMTETETAQAAAQGFAIELHTHNHSLGNFSFADIEREITLNRATLSRILNVEPQHFTHFCYPSGHVVAGVQRTLSRLGIESATTLEPGLAWPGADPLMLPRIVDGDHLSDLEFEAELCGIADLLRQGRNFASECFRLSSKQRTASLAVDRVR